MKKWILGFVILLILGLFLFLRWGKMLIAIEDNYGDLQELYFAVEDDENYIVIFKNQECGFLEKLERNLYVSEDDCLKSILNYSNQKMEVYQVEITETYLHFNIEEALKLKSKPTSKLIYKN